MGQVLEYNYYTAALIVGIHTPRINPSPATIFLAGTLHAELAAKIRGALREYKTVGQTTTGLSAYLPTQGGFPLYGIRKIQPSGAPRSVDEDFNIEVTSCRFGLEIAILESTYAADEAIWMAIERNIEKAAQDLFKSLSIPCRDIEIPSNNDQLGSTFVDILCELGATSGDQGLCNVPGFADQV